MFDVWWCLLQIDLSNETVHRWLRLLPGIRANAKGQDLMISEIFQCQNLATGLAKQRKGKIRGCLVKYQVTRASAVCLKCLHPVCSTPINFGKFIDGTLRLDISQKNPILALTPLPKVSKTVMLVHCWLHTSVRPMSRPDWQLNMLTLQLIQKIALTPI